MRSNVKLNALKIDMQHGVVESLEREVWCVDAGRPGRGREGKPGPSRASSPRRLPRFRGSGSKAETKTNANTSSFLVSERPAPPLRAHENAPRAWTVLTLEPPALERNESCRAVLGAGVL